MVKIDYQNKTIYASPEEDGGSIYNRVKELIYKDLSEEDPYFCKERLTATSQSSDLKMSQRSMFERCHHLKDNWIIIQER